MAHTNDAMARSLYQLPLRAQVPFKTTGRLSALKDPQFHKDYLPSVNYFGSGTEKMKESEEKGKESIPKLIRNFLGYTTAHGFSRLSESKGVCWKIFWALVCLGSFGMFIYQARGLFLLYLSRPITTSVRISFEKQVPFPAVTICNQNMLRSDKVPNELKQEMLNLLESYNSTSAANQTNTRRRRDVGPTHPPGTTKPLTTYGHVTSHTTASHTISRFGTFHTTRKPGYDEPWHGTTRSSYHTTSSSYRPSAGTFNPSAGPHYPYGYPYGDPYKTYYNDDYNNYRYVDREYLPSEDEIDKNVLFLDRFTTAVTKVPVDILVLAGHQFEEFVKECTWRKYDCKNSNFSNWWRHQWHYKYGNCFTFNGGVDRDYEPIRVLSTSKPGPSQGLSLRLDIQQKQYLKHVSDEAGVRVMLHDQGVMPFPYLEGFSVSPGMSTSVGMRKTLISRVDRFANHTCWNINELEDENIYRKFHNITKYTQQTCLNSCIGETQLEECGCSEYSYPSNISACDTFNTTIRQCLWKVHLRFNNDLLPCMTECRQPCREDVVEKTISMSQWPSTRYQTLEKEKNANFSAESSLLLNIFYNELNYQRIEESFVYDEINLLADIGGQLGLWIGVSVITVFELIELLMLITIRLFRHNKYHRDRVHDLALP